MIKYNEIDYFNSCKSARMIEWHFAMKGVLPTMKVIPSLCKQKHVSTQRAQVKGQLTRMRQTFLASNSLVDHTHKIICLAAPSSARMYLQC